MTVTADTRGAELVSVLCDGKERLWQNEDGSWSGHAPLLFPVCGHFGVTVNGKDYPLPPHGFARKREFTLEARGENFLRFSLVSDEETKRVYPFSFRFTVNYELQGTALNITYEVHNPQEKPLFFSCGGHESFVLASDIENYKLVFPKPVHLMHFVNDEDGYLTGETRDFGTRRELALPKDILQNNFSLILGNLSVRAVRLCTNEDCVAELSFPDFAHLLLWRPNDAKMICIEPWGNLPDGRGEQKEFSQKAGVVRVEPHETKTLTHTITY